VRAIPISTSKRKNSPDAQIAAPWRLRSPLACMAMSLVLAGFAVPFVRTVAGQLGEIMPDIGGFLWNDPVRAAAYRVIRDRQIYAIRGACQQLANDSSNRPDVERFRQADPDNGLYVYLEVLAALRQTGTDESVLRDRLYALRNAPKSKLYLARQYRLARAVFSEAGLPPRRAARAAEEMRSLFPYLRDPEMRETHGPLLCELTRRLRKQGNSWRESGRFGDALAAHLGIVRLWTELAEESPTSDVVLLASELLPNALRELERDADAIGLDQPITVDGLTLQEHSERVASLHARWHALADRDGTNVLPFTGGSFHVLLAPRQHLRVMGSLCISLLFVVTWLVLFILCLFFLAVAIVTYGPVDATLTWQRRRYGKMLAVAIVCVPAILCAAGLWTGWLDFTWLISLPTFWAICPLPALIPVMIGLSARLQLAPSAQLTWSKVGTWIAISVLALTAVLGPVLFATQKAPWQPPRSIQSFRTVTSFLGLESIVILALWMAVAFLRHIGDKFSLRSWSRIYLHVASAALLVLAVLSLTLLVANHHLDMAHQRAFAQAAADPCSDRLGEAWYETYFAGTCKLARQLTNLPQL